jgi:6,7-dimethyl-8-ribityllumazine synthase
MSSFSPTTIAIDGTPFSVGVVAARYNPKWVEALLNQVLIGLRAAGVKEGKITVIRVPGSNELPSGAQWLIRRRHPDVVVALGVVIRGGTRHHELVAAASSQGLQRVALDSGVSVITGLVAVETEAQAAARCAGRINRGAEFARAALEMAALRRHLRP